MTNRKFQPGDRVRVIGNSNSHGSEIGDIVTILDYEYYHERRSGLLKYEVYSIVETEYKYRDYDLELITTDNKTEKVMKKEFNFAIESESGAILEAFTKEAVKVGYIYNTKFGSTPIEKATIRGGHAASCVYFSNNFSAYPNKMSFAPSNTGSDTKIFKLPEQWYEALKHMNDVYRKFNTKNELKLNDEYTAIVDTDKRVVRVGCQTISFNKVKELAKMCK